jgi:hypothetical protein
VIQKALAVSSVAAVVGAAALVGSASAASTAPGCGVISAAGTRFLVVGLGVPCSTATAVARQFAARTAHAARGSNTVVSTRRLPGWGCAIRNIGRPAGACSKDPTHTVIWSTM